MVVAAWKCCGITTVYAGSLEVMCVHNGCRDLKLWAPFAEVMTHRLLRQSSDPMDDPTGKGAAKTVTSSLGCAGVQGQSGSQEKAPCETAAKKAAGHSQRGGPHCGEALHAQLTGEC